VSTTPGYANSIAVAMDATASAMAEAIRTLREDRERRRRGPGDLILLTVDQGHADEARARIHATLSPRSSDVTRALQRVAATALYLRAVVSQDHGAEQELLGDWVWDRLLMALDQLESTEPAVHVALTAEAESTIADFLRRVRGEGGSGP
jgi:hypothetical protein